MDANILIERAQRLKALVEANINIDVRGIQQDAKVKAYQDAIAAGKSEAEAQAAEAAAGNTAGANALGKVNLNNPSTYINQPGQQAGPSSEAQRQEWMKDPTQAAAPKGTTAPATPAAKTQGQAGVLNVGSQGAEVSALQKKLGITADGKYGPATQQAVMALQKKLGVTADGAYGPITKAAHDKMTPGQAAKPLAPPTNTNVADAGQPGHTVANDTAPKATTDTAQANQVLQGIQAGRIDPNSAKGQATMAVPEVPVPAGNPGGVGKNQTLKPDEKAAAEEALKDPNVGARDKAYYAGLLGVPVPAQTAKPNVGAPAPAAAPATPAAAPATPQGQTAGGASTAYRVRTPKGAAAQNQPQESLDRILHLATYLK
jgi:peptidoglycan hydrolase-like protein with peptidoglycan-binding domain